MESYMGDDFLPERSEHPDQQETAFAGDVDTLDGKQLEPCLLDELA
ncbi:hypothetical protein [Pontibacter sp. G13]|nr:hypothetical protein [Pontibacter sp. G13]WNJ21603.1 hypothetical protein RJD25_28785 [Pontibacter sp. G13]